MATTASSQAKQPAGGGRLRSELVVFRVESILHEMLGRVVKSEDTVRTVPDSSLRSWRLTDMLYTYRSRSGRGGENIDMERLSTNLVFHINAMLNVVNITDSDGRTYNIDASIRERDLDESWRRELDEYLSRKVSPFRFFSLKPDEGLDGGGVEMRRITINLGQKRLIVVVGQGRYHASDGKRRGDSRTLASVVFVADTNRNTVVPVRVQAGCSCGLQQRMIQRGDGPVACKHILHTLGSMLAKIDPSMLKVPEESVSELSSKLGVPEDHVNRILAGMGLLGQVRALYEKAIEKNDSEAYKYVRDYMNIPIDYPAPSVTLALVKPVAVESRVLDDAIGGLAEVKSDVEGVTSEQAIGTVEGQKSRYISLLDSQFSVNVLDQDTRRRLLEASRRLNQQMGLPAGHPLGLVSVLALVYSSGHSQSPIIINLVGDAGIGKSRYAKALSSIARRRIIRLSKIIDDASLAPYDAVVRRIADMLGVSPSTMLDVEGGVVRSVNRVDVTLGKYRVTIVDDKNKALDNTDLKVFHTLRSLGKILSTNFGGNSGEEVMFIYKGPDPSHVLEARGLSGRVRVETLETGLKGSLVTVELDYYKLLDLAGGEERVKELLDSLRSSGFSVKRLSAPSSLATVNMPSFIGIEMYNTARTDVATGRTIMRNIIRSSDIALLDESFRGDKIEMILTETSIVGHTQSLQLIVSANNPDVYFEKATGELTPAFDRMITLMLASGEADSYKRNTANTSLEPLDPELLWGVKRHLERHPVASPLFDLVARSIVRALGESLVVGEVAGVKVIASPGGVDIAESQGVSLQVNAEYHGLGRVVGGDRVLFQAGMIYRFLKALGADTVQGLTASLYLALQGKLVQDGGAGDVKSLIVTNKVILRRRVREGVSTLLLDDALHRIEEIVDVATGRTAARDSIAELDKLIDSYIEYASSDNNMASSLVKLHALVEALAKLYIHGVHPVTGEKLASPPVASNKVKYILLLTRGLDVDDMNLDGLLGGVDG